MMKNQSIPASSKPCLRSVPSRKYPTRKARSSGSPAAADSSEKTPLEPLAAFAAVIAGFVRYRRLLRE